MNLEELGLNSMMLNMIKPYIPKITKNILPVINEQVAKVLRESDAQLMDGEVQSTVMIFKDKNDNVYLSITKLSEDDKVMRQSMPVLLTEFFKELIDNALNEKK